ncbi:MAG: AraC family transcriptional regulator [Bacteroidia bacterium]|nr:AraC family transcriptional regulator [Bacteroidia bacterium]
MNDLRRQFLLGLVGYTVNRGIGADVLCSAAGLSVESLMTPGHDFTPERESALWLEAATLTKDPLFGLHLGESLQLAALGTVGEIVKSSNAIGNANYPGCIVCAWQAPESHIAPVELQVCPAINAQQRLGRE